MKVGVLTTSFPRTEADSAGTFVLGFARSLALRGHDVEVLAPEPDSGRPPSFDGVSLRWVPYLRPRSMERTFYGAGVPDNLRRDPLAWPGLGTFPVALLKEARSAGRGWDAVVSHWALPCALVGGAVARGRPHLAVFHSADLHLLSKLPARGRIARRISTGASGLLFVTTGLRDRFLSWLPSVPRLDATGRSHVCPMGIAPPDPLPSGRRAIRQELGFERFTVLSIGRLVPIKGLDLAIRCLTGRDDIELVIAGAGPERAALEALTRERGVPVRFLGEVHGEAKWRLLAAADAFVTPSRRTNAGREEGVPTAVLEAMYSSLPVITTNTGGLSSIVTNDVTGLVIEPERPAALREAIDRLRDDRNLRRRLGRRAHTFAKGYRWEELAPRIEELLMVGD